MTPRPASHAVELTALGLGFELEPGDDRELDGAELLDLREAATWLALAPPPVRPGAGAWRRLAATLAEPRVRRRSGLARPLAIGLTLTGLGLIAAAAAVLIAARSQLAEQAVRLRRADRALAPVRAPELQVASFGGDGPARARVLIDPGSRRWLVVAFELPAHVDHDYQLWLVPADGAPISAGILERRADGVLELAGTAPSTIASFRPAISLEPRGGSTTPTTIQMVGAPL